MVRGTQHAAGDSDASSTVPGECVSHPIRRREVVEVEVGVVEMKVEVEMEVETGVAPATHERENPAAALLPTIAAACRGSCAMRSSGIPGAVTADVKIGHAAVRTLPIPPMVPAPAMRDWNAGWGHAVLLFRPRHLLRRLLPAVR